MTKTLDEQIERLVIAQEQMAPIIAKAILEAFTHIIELLERSAIAQEEIAGLKLTKAPVKGKELGDEIQIQTPEVNVAPEEPAAEETNDEGNSENVDDSPQNKGVPSENSYTLPEKLTNDTLRNIAREVMEKHNKSTVFKVLADIGPGYKAVGEVFRDDLKEAHEKMLIALGEENGYL